MAARKKTTTRDVEKNYPRSVLVAKLRRLADCIERGKRFQIQVAGERVAIPADAVINIEHERGEGEEELEFQLKWTPAGRKSQGRPAAVSRKKAAARHA